MKSDFEIKKICDKYSYPDKKPKDKKVLAGSIQANCSTPVTSHFLFKLCIDFGKKVAIPDLYKGTCKIYRWNRILQVL